MNPRFRAGVKIGHWTILTWIGGYKRAYSCLCACGRIREVAEYQLRRGRSRSCGCRNGIDYTGQKFGRLTAVEPVVRGDGVSVWRCRCDCGNEVLVRTQSMKTGHTKSCGCARKKNGRSEDLP